MALSCIRSLMRAGELRSPSRAAGWLGGMHGFFIGIGVYPLLSGLDERRCPALPSYVQ